VKVKSDCNFVPDDFRITKFPCSLVYLHHGMIMHDAYNSIQFKTAVRYVVRIVRPEETITAPKLARTKKLNLNSVKKN
jgi:hypothetical protein